MNDLYNEIINNSNIQTILEYYGLKIEKNKCICPFHNDTHPSMSIDRNRKIVKCFACGVGGNAISFIQKYENEINHNNISVKDAMQKAIDIQNLNIKIPKRTNITVTKEQQEKNSLINIIKEAITICENNLKNNNRNCQKALGYLGSRNFSKEILDYFHIGFDVGTNTITDNLVKKYKIEDLLELGITNQYDNEYKDVFNNRIVIPIFDENSYPVGFGARVIDNNAKPKYINSKANKLFNKSNILFNYNKAKLYARNDEIIVVEGYMDVISAKTMKIDNVVGSMGTSITKEQIALLKKLKSEITLCLDNDEAGRDAMIRIIPELLNAKLKVSVLDISTIGNFKDFGDLQMAKINRETIYKTKISALHFLLKHKYFVNKEFSIDNISGIFDMVKKDNLVKNTKDILNFKEFITKNTNYTKEEIENILNPTAIKKDRITKYKDIYFYYYILNLIKDYSIKKSDYTLQKYIEAGNLKQEDLLALDNEKYLKDNENTINIGSYIKECILNSKKFIDFKENKIFLLERLFNNVKSFNSKGEIVNINLTMEQKEKVISQYNNSFNADIKNYIENNPDEFEEIFVANNSEQFTKLFPKTYIETLKEQAISRFQNNGVMEAVRYALAYPKEMKSAMNEKIVKNEKFKTLLVFNNRNNVLDLTPKNLIEEKSKEQDTKEEKKIELNKEKKPMAIFIKMNGNEKETSNGIYLDINNNRQIFIPKELYQKNDNNLEIISSQRNQANMSEYDVNKENHTKKWVNRLSLNDFYHKYFNIYEVKMLEKEVMV